MDKKPGYKRAYYRSIPAYFNQDTNDIYGRNWICDKLIELNLWIDVYIVEVDEFPILVEDGDEEDNK